MPKVQIQCLIFFLTNSPKPKQIQFNNIEDLRKPKKYSPWGTWDHSILGSVT